MLQMMYNTLPSSPFKRVENNTLITDNDNNHDMKNFDVSKNEYIIEMEKELLKAQENIGKEINNKNYHKKTIETLKTTLTQVYTNDKYMITELKNMKTLDSHNIFDLKRAIENIKKINSICDEIFNISK